MKKKKTKKINYKSFIKQLLISILYLIIFAAIGVFLAYNSIYGNPDRTVSRVLENYAGNNWGQLYSLSNIQESDFVNVNTFVNAMSNKFTDVDLSTIKQQEVTYEGEDALIKVSYIKNDTTISDTLRLIKTEEKTQIFFPVWKLNLDDYIITDVTIKAPYGYSVTLDGIDITQCDRYYIPQENMVEYYIDRIFSGTHALSCKLEGMQDINEYIELSEENKYYATGAEKVIMEEYLATNAPELVFGLYKCGLESTGVDTLMGYFTEDGKVQLQTLYDELYADINQEDGAYLKIIEDVDYDVSICNSVEDESVDVLVNFTCTYWAKTPRNTTSGVRKDYEGTAESTVVVHYAVTDDGYKATGMDFECIDYRRD